MKIYNLLKSLIILVILFAISQPILAQITISEGKGSQSISVKRKVGLQMLDDIKDIVKKYYYDTTYNGINLEDRFKNAKELVKTKQSNAEIFRVIAQVLLDFNDSHTKFYPPARSTRVEYGFSMQMIGNDCYVVDVKKGSNAEAKGLKPGDQVIDLEGYAPSRNNLWVMEYVLYHLEPREGVTLVAKNPQGEERKYQILAQLKTLKDRRKEKLKDNSEKPNYKCNKLGNELVACKLYTFIIENKEIDKMMKEVGQNKKMILDLRGNGGGYLKALSYLAGFFFDRNIKIGDEKLRDKTVELLTKSQKDKFYNGNLIVLVDSDSGSAAEIFSGTIQVEKRGKIIGDVTAGAVMASYSIPMVNERGIAGSFQTLSFYGVSVTIADFILSNGKRLEKVGVMPDIMIGPSGQALSKKQDPVLAYSIQEFGVNINQDEAGAMNFMIEKSEEDKENEKEKKDN